MNPITREESLLDGQDLTPITRKEQFIKRIYDKTQEVPTPVTREEYFLKKAGEGTSPVTVEQLSVTENGTYTAPSGTAYSPIEVNVPSGNALFASTPTTLNLKENIVNIDIPEGITTISANCFQNNSQLTDVILPNSLTDISNLAFFGTGLTDIDFPIGLINIFGEAFKDTLIQEIELFHSLERCESHAFLHCPVKRVKIHSQRMLSLDIFDSLQDSDLLEEVRIDSYTPPRYNIGAYNFNANSKFYVPTESVDIYKNTYTGIANQLYGMQIQDPSTVIADWDFSSATPLVDSINGYVLDDNNVSFQDGKAIFRDTDSYLKLPISPITDPNIDFYEYEIEVSQVNAGTRMFVQSNNFGGSADTSYGLFYYQNKWQFWSVNTQIALGTSLSNFDNSIIRVRLEKITDKIASVTIFKDSKVIAGDTYAYFLSDQTSILITDFNIFSLGSHRSSCNMDIKRLRVRTGKYEEV